MKAMILAAGEGTRLQPLTYEFPKPMVPIVNRPVMEHILVWLSRHGIQEMVVNTHYKADQIEDYFGDGAKLGVSIQYSREKILQGTAGGVRVAMNQFKETFLVIGADDLSDVNLEAIVEFHKKRNALATIGLKVVEETRQYGVVVTDSDGRILRFQEKPKPEEALSHLANTGIYIFEPEIFKFIPENEKFDFGRQVFPLLLEKNQDFFGCPAEGYWCDVGSLAEYKESHWAILENRCKAKMEGKLNAPGVWVEESVLIHPTAKIEAPCVLGKGTKIGEEVILRGHVVTGKNTIIEKGAHLDHVITWEGSRIGEGALLDDCVVSQSVVVPSGSHLKETVITA